MDTITSGIKTKYALKAHCCHRKYVGRIVSFSMLYIKATKTEPINLENWTRTGTIPKPGKKPDHKTGPPKIQKLLKF